MQVRIIRTCALENLGEFSEASDVLEDELDRYNNHQVHSTTGEIPRIRFERALAEGNSLLGPFSLPALEDMPQVTQADLVKLTLRQRLPNPIMERSGKA